MRCGCCAHVLYAVRPRGGGVNRCMQRVHGFGVVLCVCTQRGLLTCVPTACARQLKQVVKREPGKRRGVYLMTMKDTSGVNKLVQQAMAADLPEFKVSA